MGMCMLMCVYIHMFICILISSCITLFKFSHPKVTLVNCNQHQHRYIRTSYFTLASATVFHQYYVCYEKQVLLNVRISIEAAKA